MTWKAILLIVLLSILGCSRDLLPKPAPERPLNLILITVDTVRADRYGAYGYRAARTPIADQLAKEGASFDYAIAPIARTTPALASMLTGLWPREHGSRDVHEPVRDGVFITTLLKDQGFVTAAVTANPVAGKKQGFAKGFDAFVEQRRSATKITDQALALEADAPKDERLFLWVHYFDPHTPYRAPAEWRVHPQEECDALLKIDRGLRRANAGGHAEVALDAGSHAYDAEIAYTDAEIGRLLKGLRKAGRLDNAVVIFTSDHGENLGEWGSYYGHGTNVHDAALRVPLIIAGRGVAKGVRIATPIGLHDLAPTMLSLMNVPDSKWPEMSGSNRAGRFDDDEATHGREALAYGESGQALLIKYYTALLSGRKRTGYCVNKGDYALCWKGKNKPGLYNWKRDPDRERDVQRHHPELCAELMAAKDRWAPGEARQQSVSNGRFKLVERPRLEGGYTRSLYDLRADSDETRDVQQQHPDDYARLSKALGAWTSGVPDYAPMELSDDEEAQLRALGYIE